MRNFWIHLSYILGLIFLPLIIGAVVVGAIVFGIRLLWEFYSSNPVLVSNILIGIGLVVVIYLVGLLCAVWFIIPFYDKHIAPRL